MARTTVHLPLSSENWHAIPYITANTANFMFNRPDRDGTDALGNPIIHNVGTMQVHECDPVAFVTNHHGSVLVDFHGMRNELLRLLTNLAGDAKSAGYAKRVEAIQQESNDYAFGRCAVMMGFAAQPLYLNDVSEQNLSVAAGRIVRGRNTGTNYLRPFDLVMYRVPTAQDAKMDYTLDDGDTIIKHTLIAVPNGTPRALSIMPKDPEKIDDRDPLASSWYGVTRCLSGRNVAPGEVSDMLMV
jgi:hypothetical protein